MEKKLRDSVEDFVMSRYGIRIRKVCASCRWKRIDGERAMRTCTLTGGRADSSCSCPRWQLSEGRDESHSLLNAGRGGGRVMTHAEIDRNRRLQQRLYDERARERKKGKRERGKKVKRERGADVSS